MLPGRKPRPTAQHRARGTYRPDRHGKKVADTDKGVPPCPLWLSEKAKAVWIDVAPLLNKRSVLTKADGIALGAFCENVVEYTDLKAEIEAEGRTYKTTTPAGDAMSRPNPKVAMLDAAYRRMTGGEVDFGLNPSARARISPIGEKDPENEWNKL